MHAPARTTQNAARHWSKVDDEQTSRCRFFSYLLIITFLKRVGRVARSTIAGAAAAHCSYAPSNSTPRMLCLRIKKETLNPNLQNLLPALNPPFCPPLAPHSTLPHSSQRRAAAGRLRGRSSGSKRCMSPRRTFRSRRTRATRRGGTGPARGCDTAAIENWNRL